MDNYWLGIFDIKLNIFFVLNGSVSSSKKVLAKREVFGSSYCRIVSFRAPAAIGRKPSFALNLTKGAHMALLDSTKFAPRYPYVMLSRKVITLFDGAKTDISGGMSASLKVLECFCHLLGFKIDFNALSQAHFNDVVAPAFLGALYNDEFLGWNLLNRRRVARRFLDMLKAASAKGANIRTFEWSPDLLEKHYPDWISVRDKVNPEHAIYWNGWPVQSRKGKTIYLDFSRLWLSHGHDFVVGLHDKMAKYSLKNARGGIPLFNEFVNHVSASPKIWPVETFTDSMRIPALFESFMVSFFRGVSERGEDLRHATKRWKDFVVAVESVFVQPGVWAKSYYGDLPRPSTGDHEGARKNLKKNSDGDYYVDNLLTDVPLHFTNEAAIKFLFEDIDRDINDTQSWARKQAWAVRRAQLRRQALAKKGHILSHRSRNGRSSSIEELGLENMCATFETEGFCPNDRTSDRRYGNNLTKLGQLFGMPTTRSLYPFQCLMVIAHNDITESFLADFDLYNKKGQRSGFVKLDGGYYLIGYKDRKGKDLSEQKILLSPRTAVLVRQVIEITQPLRNYLKSVGDPLWRKLFITSAKGFAYPKKANAQPWTADQINSKPHVIEKIVDEFKACTSTAPEKLKRLVIKLSLRRLRASCGVRVFIRTRNVEEMAKALGHTEYRPDLLDSYLPVKLQEFFDERWVRIFQRAVVCWSLDDEALALHNQLGFQSIYEFDEFMKVNALRELPASLTDPTGSKNILDNNNELVISVNTEILTDLLSLKMGVDELKGHQEINSLALYWAKFADLLASHIEEMIDPMVKRHLRAARELAKPWPMESIQRVAA